MSLDNPPEIPYTLTKELADLLQRSLADAYVRSDMGRRGTASWEREAELAIEEYKNLVAK